MYVCLECRTVFKTPHTNTETAWGIPFAEWNGCPSCNCAEFVPLRVCSICCESIVEDCIRLKDGSYVCPDCFERVSVFDE